MGGLWLMGSMPVAFAEEETLSVGESFDDGMITYTVTGDLEATVTGCDTSASVVNVMPDIDGYKVVAIADEAFAGCESLIGLSIADTVTTIGDGAFYGCTALQSITIPDSVTEIPAGCFFDCGSLTEINLGSETTSIGDMAFGYCTALETIDIPETVTSFGDEVFYYCVALQSFEIPMGVTELGAYTFYGCMTLEEFNIPATLEEIGAMSFLGCQCLTTITVEEGNEYYSVRDDVLYNAEGSILYVYPAGLTATSFTVPSDVQVIYAGAFFSAMCLEDITFDDNLEYIGEMAFDYCISLQSVSIPETVTIINEMAFSDCTALQSVTFEGDDDDENATELQIGNYAFFCCDSLYDVTLPVRVSYIGECAFGCTEAEEEGSGTATIEMDSGSEIIIAPVDGFTLTGYTGVAKSYAKDCVVSVDFDALDFDWSQLVFWICAAIVVIVIIFVAVGVVRRTMMTRSERAALHEAAEEAEKRDDGYKSIIDDDDDEDVVSDVPSYDSTISHSTLHQVGHATAEDIENANEADKDDEKEED